MPLKDEIFARMDELSPAERKVARALLADYPSAGLGERRDPGQGRRDEHADGAAARDAASASAATRSSRQRLRDEITDHLNSPRQPRRPAGSRHRRTTARCSRGRSPSGSQLVERLAHERAAERVRPRRRGCWPTGRSRSSLSGGYFCRYLAMVLATQLDQLLPGVELRRRAARARHRPVPAAAARTASSIVFDLRRYELPRKQAAAAGQAPGRDRRRHHRRVAVPRGRERRRRAPGRGRRHPVRLLAAAARARRGAGRGASSSAAGAARAGADAAVGGVGAHHPRLPAAHAEAPATTPPRDRAGDVRPTLPGRAPVTRPRSPARARRAGSPSSRAPPRASAGHRRPARGAGRHRPRRGPGRRRPRRSPRRSRPSSPALGDVDVLVNVAGGVVGQTHTPDRRAHRRGLGRRGATPTSRPR